jgi:ABC-type branched-subunit amino acid transport system substrate-binding protein
MRYFLISRFSPRKMFKREIRSPFLLAIVVLAINSSRGMAVPFIGYGSSNAIVPAKSQELVLMGFELGFAKAAPTKNISDYIRIEQNNDHSQLGALISAKNLIKEGAVALVGFPTSHEALLAARIAKENGMLGIFAGAGHNDLANMGPTIFSTGESIKQSVEDSLRFVSKEFKGSTGFFVVNPSAVFSHNHSVYFKQALQAAEFSGINIKEVFLTKDLILNESDLNEIRTAKSPYLMLSFYVDEAAKLLWQLDEKKIDVPLFATPAWTTDDVEFVKRILQRKKTPVFSLASWNPAQPVFFPFARALKEKFGRTPSSEMVYGYDLGIIVGTIVKRIDGRISKEAIIRSFHKDVCFEGATFGELCFDPNGGHARRKLNVVKWSKAQFQKFSSN